MKQRHKRAMRRNALRSRRSRKEQRNKHLRELGCGTVYIDQTQETAQPPKRLSEMTKDEIFEAWMREPIRGRMERALRVAFIGRGHPK